MPFRQPPKGGEGNALNDYGVGFAARDDTVSLVAHYTPETSVGPHNAALPHRGGSYLHYTHCAHRIQTSGVGLLPAPALYKSPKAGLRIFNRCVVRVLKPKRIARYRRGLMQGPDRSIDPSAVVSVTQQMQG